MVKARLFWAFPGVSQRKRTLNKVKHGLLTFGDVPPPIPLYAGPTGRSALAAQNTAMIAINAGMEISLPRQFADGEGNSLGNVSRGDSPLTFVDDIAGQRLALSVLPSYVHFDGLSVLSLIQPRKRSKRLSR